MWGRKWLSNLISVLTEAPLGGNALSQLCSPQGSWKVGFVAFFSFQRDLWTFLTQALLSCRQQGAFISKWPLFDTCLKASWWQATPTPTPTATGPCSWFQVSTCTSKRIWGQIQEEILFFIDMAWGIHCRVGGFIFLFFSSTTSTYNASWCLFFD